MPRVLPLMCLKVNRDTFVYPESGKGVYIRNNIKSIRVEGRTIERWLEKLIPMLDGTHTLEYVTNGLPDPFKEQVYKIVQMLYENGFVRDVSQDTPHQLPEHILRKYAPQIEYINHVKDSGGYRFQMFRQSKVAVLGSGTLLLTLVLSLIESGLTTFSIVKTDSSQVDEGRLKELIADACKSDPESAITLLQMDNNIEALKPFQTILHGFCNNHLDQLRSVQAYCRDQGKNFLPITLFKDTAFAGPLVRSETKACWESAYRRLHYAASEEKQSQSVSSIACSLLANIAVFELFKEVTGIHEEKSDRPIYLLNPETLEGNWHIFFPHPLVTGQVKAEILNDPLTFIEEHNNEPRNLHPLFHTITSKESGIFHVWEEEDLLQLPLSQCKVQVADPCSASPDKLLSEIISSGLTHEEARFDAGLIGIETYMKRMFDRGFNIPLSGIGTGKTAAEGLCRTLQNSLHNEFVKTINQNLSALFKLDITKIKEERCRFYLKSLYRLRQETSLFLGKTVFGFPVVWIRSNGTWYGSVGLNIVIAVKRALQAALLAAQNKTISHNPYGAEVSSLSIANEETEDVTFDEEKSFHETFSSALQILQKNKVTTRCFTLHAESIFNENLAGIYGMTLTGEESI